MSDILQEIASATWSAYILWEGRYLLISPEGHEGIVYRESVREEIVFANGNSEGGNAIQHPGKRRAGGTERDLLKKEGKEAQVHNSRGKG